MSSPSSAPSPTWKALIDELLMMRRSTRPPGSTLTISGSASVRKLARKASYLTSLRSGPDWPVDIGAAIFMLDVEAMAPAGFAMPAIEPELLQIFEDLFCRREAEIGQHHHDFLLVRPVALDRG